MLGWTKVTYLGIYQLPSYALEKRKKTNQIYLT
jgi:hypothetical protein